MNVEGSLLNIKLCKGMFAIIQRRIVSLFTAYKYKVQCIQNYVTLPIVFYGCETWCFTMGKKHRLRMFENRGLRKILGLKGDEVIGEWRVLRKGQHYDPYSSPNIIWLIKS